VCKNTPAFLGFPQPHNNSPLGPKYPHLNFREISKRIPNPVTNKLLLFLEKNWGSKKGKTVKYPDGPRIGFPQIGRTNALNPHPLSPKITFLAFIGFRNKLNKFAFPTYTHLNCVKLSSFNQTQA